MKFYLGYRNASTVRELIQCATFPTFETHGKTFAATVGPFKTKRGAIFMRDHGQGNPHCCTVAQAEKLGKQYADKYDAKAGKFDFAAEHKPPVTKRSTAFTFASIGCQ